MGHRHLERLETAAPMFQTYLSRVLWLCEQDGLALLLVSTWRSVEQQVDLYKQGRTYVTETQRWVILQPEQVVTNTLLSPHTVVTEDGHPAALACDVVPVDHAGAPQWHAPEAVWLRLYHWAGKGFLDAYGDPWGRFMGHDKGHLEFPGWDLALDHLRLVKPDATSQPGL